MQQPGTYYLPTLCLVGVGRGQSDQRQSERWQSERAELERAKSPERASKFGSSLVASWGNRSKNNPPHSDFAQFMDNMAQEPDRYLLPVFQATAPRFGLLTRVRKFENFRKILPPQPLGAKVPNLVHWWGVGIPQGKIFWGPGPI